MLILVLAADEAPSHAKSAKKKAQARVTLPAPTTEDSENAPAEAEPSDEADEEEQDELDEPPSSEDEFEAPKTAASRKKTAAAPKGRKSKASTRKRKAAALDGSDDDGPAEKEPLLKGEYTIARGNVPGLDPLNACN